MYRLFVDDSFASAHRLDFHQGKCRNLHGHNWRVTLCVGAETLDPNGMVMDFSDLRSALKEACDKLDHRFVNEVEPFDKQPPTAENISKWFFDGLRARIDDDRVRVVSVRVGETDRNVCEYSV